MLKFILIISTIFLISCEAAKMPSDEAIKHVARLCEQNDKTLYIYSTYGFVKIYCIDTQ